MLTTEKMASSSWGIDYYYNKKFNAFLRPRIHQQKKKIDKTAFFKCLSIRTVFDIAKPSFNNFQTR